MPKTSETNPAPPNRTDCMRQALDLLREARSALVVTHVDPDGDGIGSMLAAARLLRCLGTRHVTCTVDGTVPTHSNWLPGAADIKCPHEVDDRFDLAVVVDTAERRRTGSAAPLLEQCARILVLDHHAGTPGEAFAIADPAYAAAGEIVAELFEAAAIPIPPDAALCLYVAVATDTGGFRFGNTTSRTHRIAATLLDAGVDVAAVSARLFDALTVGRFKLMRRVLGNLELLENGRVACVGIRAADLREDGAKEEDFNNLVNLGRNIDGVIVSILLRETADGATKASFRSREGFDSAAMAAEFGGGGHVAAAGVTMQCGLEEARREILARVSAVLGEK